MEDEHRRRLRSVYAQSVLDSLAHVAAIADSDYLRYHALKLLAGHHGIEHVIHPMTELARKTESDWVRLHAAAFVGRHLRLFSETAAHRNPEPMPVNDSEYRRLEEEFSSEFAEGIFNDLFNDQLAVLNDAHLPPEPPLRQPPDQALLNQPEPQPNYYPQPAVAPIPSHAPHPAALTPNHANHAPHPAGLIPSHANQTPNPAGLIPNHANHTPNPAGLIPNHTDHAPNPADLIPNHTDHAPNLANPTLAFPHAPAVHDPDAPNAPFPRFPFYLNQPP